MILVSLGPEWRAPHSLIVGELALRPLLHLLPKGGAEAANNCDDVFVDRVSLGNLEAKLCHVSLLKTRYSRHVGGSQAGEGAKRRRSRQRCLWMSFNCGGRFRKDVSNIASQKSEDEAPAPRPPAFIEALLELV
jgi:hypothetical protein